MQNLKNDTYIRAAFCQPTEYTPIWIMRQAGRYLPEYRAVRSKINTFTELYKNVELATEVTLQPIRRFNLDAAILFSDILVIPEAMGLKLNFQEGVGPKFSSVITSLADIDKLKEIEPEQDLSFVLEAIQLIQSKLAQELPLIGFAGSPFTIASYMIEGGSSKTFQKIKTMLYKDPAVLHALLDFIAQAVVKYLNAQIKAGVNAVMLFDSWGGCLGHREYNEFSLKYMRYIIENLTRSSTIPVTIFTKGGGLFLDSIAATQPNVIGLDWTMHLATARHMVPNNIALQGNLDPNVLHASQDVIQAQVERLLHDYGNIPGHIFNLGHGIDKDTPPENVEFLVNLVHKLSKNH